jgi:hypothetical protein
VIIWMIRLEYLNLNCHPYSLIGSYIIVTAWSNVFPDPKGRIKRVHKDEESNFEEEDDLVFCKFQDDKCIEVNVFHQS